MSKILIPTVSLAIALSAMACAPSVRPKPSLPPASSSPAKAPDSAPIITYDRAIDPLARAFDAEQNIFYQRAIARMWLASASFEESPGHPRIAAATLAMQTAESKQPQGCDDPLLEAALSRVEEQKSSLERRYLEMTDRMGEDHRECRSLDAQIHALRDDLGALEAQAHPCRQKALSPSRSKK